MRYWTPAMFYPRGKALHENLATSYVLVDALIDDLCEGGFSGIVEILLHDADGHVIVERGKVAAALLKSNQKNESSVSIQELAARSRAERGRVSIYSYSTDVAVALARRADAAPLYTQLSTDFADLGKMLSKLARERDREWLIEVMTKSGSQALIYLREADCLVVTPDGDTEAADRVDLTGSRALDDLLAECNQMGGTFDVYFRREKPAYEKPAYEKPAYIEERAASHVTPPLTPDETTISASEPAAEIESPPVQYKVSQAAMNQSQSVMTDHRDANLESVSPAPVSPEAIYHEAGQATNETDLPYWVEDDADDATLIEELKTSGPHEPLPDARSQGLTAHLFASASVAESASEAEMIEVKRLMGEIARTVEDAIRAVSQQSNFAMHLRAGQLRVADRYPFLDPFGNEFEYLAGEIAFVGKVKPVDFINGLTEALRLALVSAIQSSSHPARLRTIAAEDLRVLGERYRSGFEEFGLDQSVERILEA